MAQTDHLPIYRAACDLCLHIEQALRKLPRYQKYTVGTDLREGARRVLKLIVRANVHHDKAPAPLEVREEVEALKAVLPLAHDVRRSRACAPSSTPSCSQSRWRSRTRGG